MSIDGRVTVDALFHDTDGAAINVLSMQSATSGAVSKAAMLTGSTDFTGFSFLPDQPLNYRDASGNPVSFASVYVIAIRGNDLIVEALGIGPGDEESSVFVSLYSNGEISVTRLPYQTIEFRVRAANATTDYSILLYGQ